MCILKNKYVHFDNIVTLKIIKLNNKMKLKMFCWKITFKVTHIRQKQWYNPICTQI